MTTLEKYTEIKVKFSSNIKTGNHNVDRVTAIYKPSPERRAALILLHGFTMKKEDFLDYGDLLNSGGISSFHPDLPYHGERGIHGNGYEGIDPSKDRIVKGIKQAVSDIEHSVSLLRTVGHERIGIAGYSLGGILTLLMMGRSSEFRKGIAIGAGGGLADIILNSPISQQISNSLREKGVLEADLSEGLRDYEPCNFAQYINPDSLMMINGTLDEIVPPKNTKIFLDSLTSKPQIYWQECDHYSPQFLEHAAVHLEDFAK